eukprot:CAMPEP_0184674342 /NCGR_PEP_ID=MMETSP0308-20130426/87185_1 /TAXON_ID=38269 /ORGANISM="Gloeochaete witrockiana, Strain SAG 46.84" /LENGTH=273 /DNA_ID=CAMNT_0027121933 /DNA_START=398 /DNA_END=1219 /DNA_ORIENTATION=-
MAEVRSQKEELSSKVTAGAQSLIDAIMEKQRGLLSQIETIANAKTKSLSEQMDLVATFKADTEQSNDFVQKVISEGRTVDILSLKASLVSRLSDCKSHAIRLDPSEEANVRLSFDVSSIVSSILSCGSMTICQTSSSFSTLSGDAITDLRFRVPIWKGIQLDVDVTLYCDWTCLYQRPYSHLTTVAEIDAACDNYKYALVGAYHKDSPTRLALAAWGETAEILKKTTSATEAHEVNGAYWYFNAQRSFGFAPIARIDLINPDISDPSDTKREI